MTFKAYLPRPDLPCPKCSKNLVEEIIFENGSEVKSTGIFSCEDTCGIMPSRDFSHEKTEPENIPLDFIQKNFQ